MMPSAQRTTGRPAPDRHPVVHELYGIRVRSAWPVAGVPDVGGRWDVELLEGDPRVLAEAASHVPPEQRDRWSQYATLPDGSSYRRCTGLFEFLVAPDARRIHARALEHADDEALLAYLLVDALSFSMVRLGWEPLHATAVATGHGTIGLIGESGYGKSTLGAILLHSGGRLLTDDMLILVAEGGTYRAQPGPPRIKLYREIASRTLGAGCHGVPMNAVTKKLIIPLDETRTARQPSPLDAIYLIEPERDGQSSQHPAIQRLSPAEALPRILAATAAHFPSDRDRLARQFAFITGLVQRVPVSTIAYRRNTADMSILRDAVLADVAATRKSTG
jgi:hypothetical protein